MKPSRIKELIGFYENELTNNLLFFWLPRCLDDVHGGYFNCFDNSGKQLLSRDKYTWSQGRFVWLFAKLAMMETQTFTGERKAFFLELARSGRDFLFQHALIAPDDWRCVFLTDEAGQPKLMPGADSHDSSIYADCFVIGAFARYALAAGDKESYVFARKLHESVLARLQSGRFQTHPYPLSPAYRAHGIPMILSNVTQELYLAASCFDSGNCPVLKEQLGYYLDDILNHFAGGQTIIREVIGADNQMLPNLLGQHANPGHSLECIWFLIEAAETLNREEAISRLAAIAQQTFTAGWDTTYGGLLHYCYFRGGPPSGPTDGVADEPMLRQVQAGWGDKLWWVHSEALYTTLLCYTRTGKPEFMRQYEQLFDYTFRTFPNPDRDVREWIQICQRDGTPQDKVVALPVKDPYHIMRNVILILELLYRQAQKI